MAEVGSTATGKCKANAMKESCLRQRRGGQNIDEVQKRYEQAEAGGNAYARRRLGDSARFWRSL